MSDKQETELVVIRRECDACDKASVELSVFVCLHCRKSLCYSCGLLHPCKPNLTTFDRLDVLEDEVKRNRADLLMQARRLETVERSLHASSRPTACECADGPEAGRLWGYCGRCGLPERGVQIG